MNYVRGTSSADFIAGLLKEMNEIHGLQDGDTLLGGHLSDRIIGGEGDDLVWGDGGNDVLEGNSGFDVIFGSNGNDIVRGGTDNDFLSGGKDNDLVTGGKGDDVLTGNSGNDDLQGNSGDDYLFGTKGDDKLNGGSGDDYLDGGSDNDRLMASTGNDSYIGGSGFDTLDLSGVRSAVTIDLSKHEVTFSAHGVDYASSIGSIEQVVANDAGVHAMGSSKDNVFVGGAGDDWMRGKGGADTFTGGAGDDTFVWLKKDVTDGKGVDHVTDFQIGQDVMDLSDFVKGGQSYANVIRMVDTSDGILVQGNAKGVWADVAVLDGLHNDANHQMTLADIGLL